ncbi:hypothetical protein BN109_007 [Yersinia phage phi80-18]|uniref:Uncharacterized protein n=1 Tax=Yersinia phage phi80-18 TaxID=1206559 RepID=I7K3D6_9CAUD|nr:hypothetical protein BN109_007 [Yersinia phage phi80-18]CCI88846.2 hypothetical protein BN109_007 [Yersinia phage phi80-18]
MSTTQSNWITNKGRVRAPFKAGTKIDVRLRVSHATGGFAERRGVTCGKEIVDWTIEGINGDVLEYRLAEKQNEKES